MQRNKTDKDGLRKRKPWLYLFAISGKSQSVVTSVQCWMLRSTVDVYYPSRRQSPASILSSKTCVLHMPSKICVAFGAEESVVTVRRIQKCITVWRKSSCSSCSPLRYLKCGMWWEVSFRRLTNSTYFWRNKFQILFRIKCRNDFSSTLGCWFPTFRRNVPSHTHTHTHARTHTHITKGSLSIDSKRD